MKRTLLLGLVALGATAFAASDTLKVNLFQDSVIEGKAFKAGDYNISMENGIAVLKQGKESVQIPAREATEANKFERTELIYKGNTTNLEEIGVGGTHTRIIFE